MQYLAEIKKQIMLWYIPRDTGEIWNIDSRHNKLNKIDLPYEYLNYLYTDNGKILISSDNTVYGELDSFLTKNNEAFI